MTSCEMGQTKVGSTAGEVEGPAPLDDEAPPALGPGAGAAEVLGFTGSAGIW